LREIRLPGLRSPPNADPTGQKLNGGRAKGGTIGDHPCKTIPRPIVLVGPLPQAACVISKRRPRKPELKAIVYIERLHSR